MDRSFLSQPDVIQAAQKFVCIRLATYENTTEARFLQTICPTGSGQLENTVFGILSPDGKRQLVRTARSARDLFTNAEALAKTMSRIAGWYPAASKMRTASPDLPRVATVRLALDVAACDNQPLAVIYARDQASRERVLASLKRLAWTDEFRGRLVYAVAANENDLTPIAGVVQTAKLMIVQPDRFGLKGTVLQQTSASDSDGTLAETLRKALAMHTPQTETFEEHVRAGHRSAVFWETAVPVTDPMEQAARERGRRVVKP